MNTKELIEFIKKLLEENRELTVAEILRELQCQKHPITTGQIDVIIDNNPTIFKRNIVVSKSGEKEPPQTISLAGEVAKLPNSGTIKEITSLPSKVVKIPKDKNKNKRRN